MKHNGALNVTRGFWIQSIPEMISRAHTVDYLNTITGARPTDRVKELDSSMFNDLAKNVNISSIIVIFQRWIRQTPPLMLSIYAEVSLDLCEAKGLQSAKV
jgi:hypothetical protein